MTYYTLAIKGKAWLEDSAPDPLKHREVLSALAELLEENDIPRVAIQIARNAGLTEEQAALGLQYLTNKNYIKETKPPQPSDRAETPKIRFRPIEDIVASEIRTIEAQKRYTSSEKGKTTHSKYEGSKKGKTKNKVYRTSERGRLAHKTYRLKRRLKELTNFLAANPDKEIEIRPLITSVEAKLKDLRGNKND